MTDVRELPNSIDAEQSCLGALLIDPAASNQVADLTAAVFYRDAHRKIYAACLHLTSTGKPLELVTLVEELKRRKLIEDVGGHAYVASLVDGVPRSTNVKYYAEIVKEKAALRKLIEAGTKLTDAAYAGQQTAHELIQQTDAKLTALAAGQGVTAGAVLLQDSAGALFKELERRIDQRGQLLGISSGYQNVDLMTHGWQARKMIVIAGRTSQGKSILALECAKAAATAGHRVVYFSLEMERQELEFRLLSSLTPQFTEDGTGIPLSMINWGNIRNHAAVTSAWELMATLPIEINDTPARSVMDIRAECRQIKADRGLGMVIIDHLQLMDGATGENRTQELTDISRRLKIMAGELDVPVLALSQLSRGDKDLNREPQLWDLRESGAIEQDADVCCFLHPYNPAEAMKMPAPDVIPMKVLIRKNRGGHPGVACLNLERDCVRFVEAEPPAPAVKEPTAKKVKPRTPHLW